MEIMSAALLYTLMVAIIVLTVLALLGLKYSLNRRKRHRYSKSLDIEDELKAIDRAMQEYRLIHSKQQADAIQHAKDFHINT